MYKSYSIDVDFFLLFLDHAPFFADVMVLNDFINQAASLGTEEAQRKTSRKISLFLGGATSGGDDDDEGPRLKERIASATYRFIDIFCVWDCCYAYIRLAEVHFPRPPISISLQHLTTSLIINAHQLNFIGSCVFLPFPAPSLCSSCL